MATSADITAFVNSVIAWDQALQSCADSALSVAHVQFTAGDITADEYKQAVTQRAAVADAGADMSAAAVDAISKIGADAFQPIADATKALAAAADNVKKAENIVGVLLEAAAAAAAVATAVVGPSVVTIAAAASAVKTLVSDVIG